MKIDYGIKNEIRNEIQLNWRDFAIIVSGFEDPCDNQSESNATKHLKLAETDYNKGGYKNLTLAFEHAKTAIYLHIDYLLHHIGLSDEYFYKYTHITRFLEMHRESESQKIIYKKIRILQILDLSPGILNHRIQKIVAFVEQNYFTLEDFQIREAIEVADLFIRLSLRKLSFLATNVQISSDYAYFKLYDTTILGTDGRSIHANYSHTDKNFTLKFYKQYKSAINQKSNLASPKRSSNELSRSVTIYNDSFAYLVFLKIICTQDLVCLKNYLEYDIEDEHVAFIKSYK